MVVNVHGNRKVIRDGGKGVQVKEVNIVLNVHRNHKAY